MGAFKRLAEQMGDIERLAWQEAWNYADDCSAILREMSPSRRRAFSASLISEMLEAQRGICPLCERPISRDTLGPFHVDHIIPVAYGGGDERDNLQVVHPRCNLHKGDAVHLDDLVAYMERRAEALW